MNSIGVAISLLIRCLLPLFAVNAVWAVDGDSTAFAIPASTLRSIEDDYGQLAKDRVVAWSSLVNLNLKPKANGQNAGRVENGLQHDKPQSDASNNNAPQNDIPKNQKPSYFQVLSETNTFFNQVEWLNDSVHWGVEDYWATPLETLASNGGDCEDYSVGKYFSLIYSNIPNEKLRITYVKAVDYNQAHMVLAYYAKPGSEPLILDNINKTVLPASRRPDLIPVYSFNAEDLWLASKKDKKYSGASQKSLPQWQQVINKIRKEMTEL
ncbi:MAG: putative transglutaminase-like cysteine proteinase [Flavobacteriales bacterium]